MSELSNNEGVLFHKKEKTNPRAPDWTGNAVIRNVKYRVAAWRKTSKKTGDVFLSLSFEHEREDLRTDERISGILGRGEKGVCDYQGHIDRGPIDQEREINLKGQFRTTKSGWELIDLEIEAGVEVDSGDIPNGDIPF